MRVTKIVLAGAGLAATAVAALAFSLLAAPASSAGNAVPSYADHVQKLAFVIAGRGTGDERAFQSGNLAVAPGVVVQVTVLNYTREFHSFTVPGLDVSRLIFPARSDGPRRTTFTFTANAAGSFSWYCVFCQQGVHGHRHSMGGTVWAIVKPSILQ